MSAPSWKSSTQKVKCPPQQSHHKPPKPSQAWLRSWKRKPHAKRRKYETAATHFRCCDDVCRDPGRLPGGLVTGDCDGAISTTADSGGTGVLDLLSTPGSTKKQVTDVRGNGCPAPLRAGHSLFFVSQIRPDVRLLISQARGGLSYLRP